MAQNFDDRATRPRGVTRRSVLGGTAALAAGLAVGSPTAAAAKPGAGDEPAFVGVRDGHFVIGTEPFRFGGTNT